MGTRWEDFKEKTKKWSKKWGKKGTALFLKYGVPIIIGILTGNVYNEIKNIAKDLASELDGKALSEEELSKANSNSLLDYLKGMDMDLGTTLMEMKKELEEIKEASPHDLNEIFSEWKKEFSEEIIKEGKLTRAQMDRFEKNIIRKLEKIEHKLDIQHHTVIQYLHSIDDKFQSLISDNHNQLKIRHLKKGLALIRTSFECPECAGPLQNIQGMNEIQCPWCNSKFLNKMVVKKHEDEFSYQKLKVMSNLQINTAMMSSKMDIEYDPNLFIDRENETKIFKEFISEESINRKLFLMLGEAGFGKTWLVAHWARLLLSLGYPVFYLQFKKGIESFFSITFDTDVKDALTEIERTYAEAKQENRNIKPIIWIIDGYDENLDWKERRIIFSIMLKLINKYNNHYLLLTSRAFNWYRCGQVKSFRNTILNTLWRPYKTAYKNITLKLHTFAIQNEVPKVLERYNLPPLEKWSDNLKSFSIYPLWIRIISEWYHKHNNQLPNISTKEIYTYYFNRMQLENSHIRQLGRLCSNLTIDGNLMTETTIDRLDNFTETILNELNSAGILLYREDILDPCIRLSFPPFGWFGLSYYIYNLSKSSNMKDKKKLFKLIGYVLKLSTPDREAIYKIVKSLNIEIDIFEKVINTKESAENLNKRGNNKFNSKQFTAAKELLQDARVLYSKLGDSNAISDINKMISECHKKEKSEISRLKQKAKELQKKANNKLNSNQDALARRLFQDAITIYSQLGDSKAISEINEMLLKIGPESQIEKKFRYFEAIWKDALERQNYKEAVKMQQKALQISKDNFMVEFTKRANKMEELQKCHEDITQKLQPSLEKAIKENEWNDAFQIFEKIVNVIDKLEGFRFLKYLESKRNQLEINAENYLERLQKNLDSSQLDKVINLGQNAKVIYNFLNNTNKQQEVEGLIKLARQGKKEKKKGNLLIEKATKKLKKRLWDETIDLSKQAEEIYTRLKDASRIKNSRELIELAQQRKKEEKKGIQLIEQAIKKLENKKVDKALESAKKALRIFSKLGNSKSRIKAEEVIQKAELYQEVLSLKYIYKDEDHNHQEKQRINTLINRANSLEMENIKNIANKKLESCKSIYTNLEKIDYNLNIILKKFEKGFEIFRIQKLIENLAVIENDIYEKDVLIKEGIEAIYFDLNSIPKNVENFFQTIDESTSIREIIRQYKKHIKELIGETYKDLKASIDAFSKIMMEKSIVESLTKKDFDFYSEEELEEVFKEANQNNHFSIIEESIYKKKESYLNYLEKLTEAIFILLDKDSYFFFLVDVEISREILEKIMPIIKTFKLKRFEKSIELLFNKTQRAKEKFNDLENQLYKYDELIETGEIIASNKILIKTSSEARNLNQEFSKGIGLFDEECSFFSFIGFLARTIPKYHINKLKERKINLDEELKESEFDIDKELDKLIVGQIPIDEKKKGKDSEVKK